MLLPSFLGPVTISTWSHSYQGGTVEECSLVAPKLLGEDLKLAYTLTSGEVLVLAM